jgi:uronate dehydrogenase
MPTIALTGAAGHIGTALRTGLATPGTRLRLLDLRPVEPARSRDEARVVDLRDLDAAVQAIDGADAVVHLAANPGEGPLDRLLDENVRTTCHVLEAARRTGCRRVVLASSAHVTGFTPYAQEVGPSDPVRPDSFYAVTKVAGEALGRLYVDKYGLEVVCVRVVAFAPEPTWPMYLWGWLSPRDAVALFRAAVETRDVGYLVTYGVSANTRRPWRDDGWDVLGYAPADDAEAYAGRFDDFPPGRAPHTWQGSEFTEVGWGRPWG